MKPITESFLIINSYLESIPEWKAEIDHVRNILSIPLNDINPRFFFEQYAFVVLCSYWKEQYARKEWEKYLQSGDFSVISNRRKREAIQNMLPVYNEKFRELVVAENKLDYLQTLYMIGEVTRCHLARNIGIDCVKPDRHMTRLALEQGYIPFPLKPRRVSVLEQWEAATQMCTDIREDIGGAEKLGTIDVILWRGCNLGLI